MTFLTETNSIEDDGSAMFLTPEEMEQGDMLDSSEEDLIRPMLREWLEVSLNCARKRSDACRCCVNMCVEYNCRFMCSMYVIYNYMKIAR